MWRMHAYRFGAVAALWMILVPFSARSQPRPLAIEPGLLKGADAGVCYLRLNVAGSADIILEGDRVTFRARLGGTPIDAGSACSSAIPRQPLDYFRVERLRGKGRVLLVENPADRNQFQGWIRIDNESVIPDAYELRVSWRENDEGGPEGQRELRLTAKGSPARWVPEGSDISAGTLAGRPLSSYDNDPLRYDTSPAGQLEFRGQVDDVVEFLVRGDRLHVVTVSGQKVKVERFRFSQAMPAEGVLTAVLEKKDGRGTAELLEEPTAENGYTARIRVADPQGGADRYHWVLSWRR